MSPGELATCIEHTQVQAYATRIDIEELCDEAVEYGLAAVTINPAWTAFCAKRLADAEVAVNPTIGFPLGANTAHIKVEEALEAVRNGANELDVVMNVGALKSGYTDFVQREIEAVVRAAKEAPVSVILETCYLNDKEVQTACELSITANARFIKTSTGFGSAEATVDDVRLMQEVVGHALGVKAAGSVRTYDEALALLEAGAERVGTSAALLILDDLAAVAPES